MRRVLFRLANLFGRRRQENDLRDEFDEHFRLHVADGVAAGMTREKAEREARLKFGSRDAAAESYRDTLRAPLVEQTMQDIRYALRTMRRSPGFSLLAIATLGAGVGASVAVFSAIDPLLFRRLPYPNDSRLVSFGYFGPIDTNEFTVISSYLDWRRNPGPLEAMTAMRPGVQCDLVTGDTPRQVPCVAVEENFLATFGATPVVGRNFTPEEDRRGGPGVALISYRLWQSAFGGDLKALERTAQVDSETVRIVGILPRDFEMPQMGDVDIMRPARMTPSPNGVRLSSAPLRSFGRLRPGISVEQGRQMMEPVMRASAQLDVPKELLREATFVFRSLRDRRIQDVKSASWMLAGAMLALLLISCANVANLLLARSAARARELAMRSAIGASRGRLIRQTLAESLMLGVGGALLGTSLGWLMVRSVAALAPQGLLQLDRAQVNPRVLLFALAVSMLSALLFGLFPALESVARPGGRAQAGGPAPQRLRKLLVAAQVAMCLMLLTGASLFLKSLTRLESQNLGFEPERVMTASFTLRQARYTTPAAQIAFARQVEERLSRLADGPFALTDSIPPRGAMGRPYSNIKVVGRPPLEQGGGMVVFRRVTPGYLRTMQIPVVTGRDFTEDDRNAAEDPVILSASLARRMFGAANPLGERLDLSQEGKISVIVGVAGDTHNNGIVEARSPEYYRLRMADGRGVDRGTVALFRTAIPPDRLAAYVRQGIAALDPALPVTFMTLEEHVRGYQQRPRFLAFVVAAFAGVALLLAASGLYGVLSFLVTQRTREIGIRSAIGAQSADITRMFQKQALSWTLAGAVIGLAGSALLAGLVRSLLFEVSPYDPASILIATTVLALGAALASWFPARRAAQVDPVVALRSE